MKGWEDRWTAQQLRGLQSPHPCPLPWVPASLGRAGGSRTLSAGWVLGGGERLNPSHWLCSVAAEVNGICSA